MRLFVRLFHRPKPPRCTCPYQYVCDHSEHLPVCDYYCTCRAEQGRPHFANCPSKLPYVERLNVYPWDWSGSGVAPSSVRNISEETRQHLRESNAKLMAQLKEIQERRKE